MYRKYFKGNFLTLNCVEPLWSVFITRTYIVVVSCSKLSNLTSSDLNWTTYMSPIADFLMYLFRVIYFTLKDQISKCVYFFFFNMVKLK